MSVDLDEALQDHIAKLERLKGICHRETDAKLTIDKQW